MTDIEISAYKTTTLKNYFEGVFLKAMYSGGWSNEGIVNSEEYSKLVSEYEDSVVVTELGSSSVLCEIPELDYERLTIGGNEKFARAGCMIRLSIQGSSPMDLAIERVEERLKLLSPKLELFESDEYDDGEDPYIMIRNNLSETLIDNYQQESWYLIVDTVPVGRSMFNRNKDHYAWGYWRGGSVYVSIDEELYKGMIRVGAKEDKCVGCGTKLVGAIGSVCPLCRHNFIPCDECGSITSVKDGEYRGNRFFCNKCIALPRCRGCGYPIKVGNDKVLCERCNGIRGILEYHCGLGRQDESGGSRFKVGLEVEKEDEYWVHNTGTKEVLRQTGWIIERDSSLSNDIGFEMVSPIYPLDISEIMARILPITKLLNSRATQMCGGHIHISDTQRTPQEILLDIRGYLPLLYGLYPNRAINRYCEAKEVDNYLEQGHRQAINITDKTLEFRIFPAVKNIDQLKFRLEILNYIVRNKETDVVKVGELLLDKHSELYKILNTRISEERLKKKAEAFIDFTNYIDRDALVLDKGKIIRVIKIPKIKEDKARLLEERVKELSDSRRERQPQIRRVRPIAVREYGYFATLVDDVSGGEEELPF